jgi:hydroxyacylglutathione hydrolase
MTVIAQHIPILKDNYAWLLKDDSSGFTAIVDPAEAGPIIAAIEEIGGRLDMILLTHHHGDHIADTDVVRDYFRCEVIGAAKDAHRLPRLDEGVREGDIIRLGRAQAQVIETPGHTVGQINYFFPDGPVLLSGDTLFSLGCGRLIEGSAQQMFDSLAKLKALPPDTLVCCGHEYTESNARFALHVDPDNAHLQAMSAAASALRAQGKPTVPSRLGDEVKANPFLTAETVAIFAERRAAKDKF